MKKMLVVGLAGMLTFGGAQVALAGHSDNAGDHKPSDYGHCRALMGPGNHNGWYKDGHSVPGPFQDVIDRADADDSGDTTAEELASFCASTTPGNK